MKLIYILIVLPIITEASDKRYLRGLQEMEIVEGKTCDPKCMNGHLACKNWCDVNPDGSVMCAYGHLPNVCVECCPDEPIDNTGEILVADAACSPSCMANYLTCREKCSWNSDGSVVKCDDGHLPLICKSKCCDKEVCPEEKVCTTECTLKKWGTFYKDCLEDYSEEITKKCVAMCTAQESGGDCKELLDCLPICCTKTSEDYFHECREKYDEDESKKCVETCVET